MFERIGCCAVVALLVCLWVPSRAEGAAWPLEAGAEPLLGYAGEYVRPDGSTATHTGVDLPASAGACVLAVSEGTITFVGRVPGAAGDTVLAATIESATGERWSFMPLEEAEVSAGDTIQVGMSIGTLAAAGDVSSAPTHLHVGLRHGDLYVDPMAALTVPTLQDPTEEPAGTPEPASAEVGEVSAAPATPAQTNSDRAGSTSSDSAETESTVSDIGESQPDPAARPSVSTRQEPTVSETPAHATTSPQIGTNAKVSEAGPVDIGDTPASLARTHIRIGSHVPSGSMSGTKGSLLGWRVALAAIGLVPIACTGFVRRIRGRVTAPGDVVAAAVGR